MNDSADQSKILTIHRSERNSFWIGYVAGFLTAVTLMAIAIEIMLSLKP